MNSTLSLEESFIYPNGLNVVKCGLCVKIQKTLFLSERNFLKLHLRTDQKRTDPIVFLDKGINIVVACVNNVVVNYQSDDGDAEHTVIRHVCVHERLMLETTLQRPQI